MGENRHFDLFRYQLLATKVNFQTVHYKNKFLDYEGLIEEKNFIFENELDEIKEFKHSWGDTTFRLKKLNGLILLKLGVNRAVELFVDFKPKTIDNWPFVRILIDNSPQTQIIAIERNDEAFHDTTTVANILTRAIKKRMGYFGLDFYIRPIFEKRKFWDIINKHQGEINYVRFELVAPNLSNISEALNFNLRDIHESTNSKQTNIELSSNTNLRISSEDEFVGGMVKYASQGGGTVKMKVKGMRGLISTDETVRSIEIDSIELESEEAVKKTMKMIYKVLRENDQ